MILIMINDNGLNKNNIFEILKDEILEIKLSDFGESKFNKNTLANTSIKGTICYMAPEVIKLLTK